MRRRLAIFALFAALAIGGSVASQAEVLQIDGLRVKFDADFAPHVLPRRRPAPVRIEISGSVATTDGSHPPPLDRLEVELNRNGHVYTKGLPSCSPSLLQSTSTAEAKTRCGNALVGRGSFTADVAFGSIKPVTAKGEILAFNSRRAGKPALLLHFFGGVPIRFTLVVPLRIGQHRDGEFGTVLRTRIPKLANGFGSITHIDLSLGRRWTFGGKRRSYLSAACSAPVGFTAAPFPFAKARFRFEGHREVESTLEKVCRVR
jgi:hypothetical protein